MSYSLLTEKLIEALRRLPGVGLRSAQRMAFYLLQKGRAHGLSLANALEAALQNVGHCRKCRNLSETELCNICSNVKRDHALLCIVETPSDVVAIEQTGIYQGAYFVLMGHLSPLDGIGPDEIGVSELLNLITQQSSITEIIIATNPTVEGEATAHYLAELLQAKKIKCSRIAHGIPMGGELEYIDSNTLALALEGRQEIR